MPKLFHGLGKFFLPPVPLQRKDHNVFEDSSTLLQKFKKQLQYEQLKLE